MFGFESAAVPVGGAIGLLGGDRWSRERKRETKIKERREMGENRDGFGIILLCRYIILMCCMVK